MLVDFRLGVANISGQQRLPFFGTKLHLRKMHLSPRVKRSLLLWLHIKIAPFDTFREMI